MPSQRFMVFIWLITLNPGQSTPTRPQCLVCNHDDSFSPRSNHPYSQLCSCD